jgi:hypothetical protein
MEELLVLLKFEEDLNLSIIVTRRRRSRRITNGVRARNTKSIDDDDVGY